MDIPNGINFFILNGRPYPCSYMTDLLFHLLLSKLQISVPNLDFVIATISFARYLKWFIL